MGVIRFILPTSLIQEFVCDVRYEPGNSMGHVDGLSRNPISNDHGVVNGKELLSIISITDDWLKTVQLADDEVKRHKDILLNPDSDKI